MSRSMIALSHPQGRLESPLLALIDADQYAVPGAIVSSLASPSIR